MLHPPPHVLPVSEGADHNDSSSKACVHDGVGQNRNLVIENWNPYGLAYEFGVALVIWIDGYSHAGREKLRPGGCDLHLAFF